jgi:hypothetical protein
MRLPAGEHKVHLQFEPASWRLGLAIGATTVGLLILTGLGCVLRSTRRRAAAPMRLEVDRAAD